jgi:hypothetical protein
MTNHPLAKLRAYYPMSMIQNLIKSTDNGPTKKKLGFLYDIGCNIEKGIIKVQIPLF